MKTLPLLAVLLLVTSPFLACDDGATEEAAGGAGGSGEPDHVGLEGTFTGPNGESGLLTLTIHNPDHHHDGLLKEALIDGSVEGLLTIGGVDTTLAGTFAAPTLTVNGGGFAFTGTVTDSGIGGTYTGPNGAGTFTVQDTTDGAVQVYCGTYAGTFAGTWNLVERADGTLTGSSNPGSGLLEGTRTGDAIELTFEGGTASGTVTGTTATGTWTSSSGTGTWTGAVGGC